MRAGTTWRNFEILCAIRRDALDRAGGVLGIDWVCKDAPLRSVELDTVQPFGSEIGDAPVSADHGLSAVRHPQQQSGCVLDWHAADSAIHHGLIFDGRSAEVAEQVQAVRPEIHQRSPAANFRVLPPVAGAWRTIIEELHARGHHLTDRAGVDELFDPMMAYVESLIVADREADIVGTASLDHGPRLVHIFGHRLFT